MLKLDAYSLQHLSAARNILKQGVKKGLELEDIIAELSKYLDSVRSASDSTKRKNKHGLCPQCSKQMRYCSIIGGYYCKCGYSQQGDR